MDPGNTAPTGRDLVVFDPGKFRRDRVAVGRGFWRKLRRYLPHLPFAEDLVSAYYCATDRSTPTYVRALLMGALAYFVLPADVIPDFIAGIGFSDDASVLVAVVTAISAHLRPEHRDRARIWLARQAGGQGTETS